jgi:hypothetical protein
VRMRIRLLQGPVGEYQREKTVIVTELPPFHCVTRPQKDEEANSDTKLALGMYNRRSCRWTAQAGVTISAMRMMCTIRRPVPDVASRCPHGCA